MIQVDNNLHQERINRLVSQFRDQYPNVKTDDDTLNGVITELIETYPISTDECILTWADDVIFILDRSEHKSFRSFMPGI